MSDDILKSGYFVVSFGESLNATAQECELALLIRHWDSIKNRVQFRYRDSMFFGQGISGLNMSKLMQVLMDRLSVNWIFMKSVVANREEAESPQ